MKLTFIGAAHEVTGSCHCLEACGKKIIIDYGMEQGQNIYVNQEMPFAVNEIDYVLLTHAHIDHIGMVPKLMKEGFRGQIYATYATCNLGSIMLRDSAHIQLEEAKWKNRKGKRAGLEEIEPVYTLEDTEAALERFVPHHYGECFTLCKGIKVCFQDAGHLLGSSCIEMYINEDGNERKIVFSGDLGNLHQPLIKDPTYIKDADYVVMESTYGDRSHGPRPDYAQELEHIVERTILRGGNVVIPCFAVGRTQEVLYFLRAIKERTKNTLIKNVPVYVDSPLAVEATHIFGETMEECFDEETLELIHRGENPISFPGLKTTSTSEESQLLNIDPTPKIILSASGMCSAGRIRHHLKHNLWRKESTVVFAGYQAEGTLGRELQDGAESVKLFGEEVKVNAEITQISGISGHADREGLIRWITAFEKKPSKVFIVHGQDTVCDVFAETLRKEYGLDAEAPFSGAAFDLVRGEWIREGVKEYIQRESKVGARASKAFALLVAAGKRLMLVIQHNEGGTNRDLGKFKDQIDALCEKWDR